MNTDSYYRGGPSMKPTLRDVRFDRATGLLLTTHGVSVFNRPDNLDRFGGAYRLTFVPVELTIVRRGLDPSHFEVVPIQPMTMQEYEEALERIVLVQV
jgi:hypothetical protein